MTLPYYRLRQILQELCVGGWELVESELIGIDPSKLLRFSVDFPTARLKPIAPHLLPRLGLGMVEGCKVRIPLFSPRAKRNVKTKGGKRDGEDVDLLLALTSTGEVARQRFFEHVSKIAERNRAIPLEEVEQDIAEAVRAVRKAGREQASL